MIKQIMCSYLRKFHGHCLIQDGDVNSLQFTTNTTEKSLPFYC